MQKKSKKTDKKKVKCESKSNSQLEKHLESARLQFSYEKLPKRKKGDGRKKNRKSGEKTRRRQHTRSAKIH